MLRDPNIAFLGTETYNTRAHLVFADADLDASVDTDEIDPHADLDWRWSLGANFGEDTLLVTHEASDTDVIEIHPNSQLVFENGISLGGPLSNVTIDDEIVRFPAAGNGHLEFRASDSNIDQIIEFQRGGNSDYDLFVHQNGSPERVYTTADDQLLTEDDNPYPAVDDDGANIHTGPATLDFGADIGVSDNNDGSVTIDYTGGTVPGRVHDDGAEVLADADGLDFLDNLDVTIDSNNNFAQISANIDTLDPAAAETIGGDWTFGGSVTFNNQIAGSIDHAVSADSATTADSATEADSLSGTALSELAQLAADETITGNWTFQSSVSVDSGTDLQLGGGNARMRYSTTSGEFLLEDYSTGSATAFFEADETGVNFPEGATISNAAVATQTWVEDDATVNDSERLNGKTEPNLDVDTADRWDGFELVINGETPSTSQYIRMETN